MFCAKDAFQLGAFQEHCGYEQVEMLQLHLALSTTSRYNPPHCILLKELLLCFVMKKRP